MRSFLSIICFGSKQFWFFDITFPLIMAFILSKFFHHCISIFNLSLEFHQRIDILIFVIVKALLSQTSCYVLDLADYLVSSRFCRNHVSHVVSSSSVFFFLFDSRCLMCYFRSYSWLGISFLMIWTIMSKWSPLSCKMEILSNTWIILEFGVIPGVVSGFFFWKLFQLAFLVLRVSELSVCS